jgi:hypothetical protein
MVYNFPKELLDWRLKLAVNYFVLYKRSGAY